MTIPVSKWIGGLAEWTDGDTTFLSVAFTWKLDEAYARALFAKACGQKVRAGGPALFLVKMQHVLADVAEVGGDYPDAIARHNPAATVASRGCPGMGTEDDPRPCSFCIVPPMEGTRFTYLPDFPVRPILCDNNLTSTAAFFPVSRRTFDEIYSKLVEVGYFHAISYNGDGAPTELDMSGFYLVVEDKDAGILELAEGLLKNAK